MNKRRKRREVYKVKNLFVGIGLCLAGILLAVIVIGFFLAISFGIVAGAFWLICWAFSLVFSWKIALGVWLVLLLIGWFLRPNMIVNK